MTDTLQYRSVRPLQDCVLLGQHTAIDKSDGGIWIPPVAQGGMQMSWYVVSVGPAVKELKPGDKVITPLYFDHLTLEDGTSRKVARENQILAVLQEIHEPASASP